MLKAIEKYTDRLKLLFGKNELSPIVPSRSASPSFQRYKDARAASRELLEEAGGELYGETIEEFDIETQAFLEFLGKE